jgi:hypothetical protein
MHLHAPTLPATPLSKKVTADLLLLCSKLSRHLTQAQSQDRFVCCLETDFGAVGLQAALDSPRPTLTDRCEWSHKLLESPTKDGQHTIRIMLRTYSE